jgi:hypothetical protein
MTKRDRLLQLGIGALVFAPFPSFAADCPSGAQTEGLKAVSPGSACNDTALGGKVNDVVNALFLVIGAISVIIIIFGGIYYITSTGDSGRIQRAKDTILYAVIGLIVAILAYAIVGFVNGVF